MKVLLTYCALIFVATGYPTACTAQYFQQQVDYAISVTLDTRQHFLRGSWEMTYHNHSPDTLHKIVMHLWPNAYSSRNTAFARQQLRLGSTEFHFAPPADCGFIDSLDFNTIHGRLPWSLDAEHPDIATVYLAKPLPPGGEIRVTSPMRIKIPTAFSRLGRIGDSYQITQWFPKPAVYDRDGWHPMPYLSQGEFFSEFGAFDVHMTLPENYLVAATGVLHTHDAMHLLDSLAVVQNAPLAISPPDASRMRTWHYSADQVHDFAWFADKRFAVRKAPVQIGEHSVNCWAFFTTTEQVLWESAPEYLGEALQFFSHHVGDYPYPQMTAVQIPEGKDFGMEYPMITSINLAGDAKSLDDVLTHEVGHNWFYGILASNERRHPWMDEGMTTFYELAYLRQKYGEWSQHILPWKINTPDGLSDEQRIMQHLAREGQLRAPDTDPEYSTEWQNFFGAYMKPALAFHMLQEYLGEDMFAAAIQEYFNTWKFRHPAPHDLQAVLTKYCDCDLAWFFDGLIGTDALIDYRITGYSAGQITIENRGKIVAPVHLLAYAGERIVNEAWYPGFIGKRTFHFDDTRADRVQIFKEVYTLDATPGDQVLFINNGRTQKSRLRLRIAGGKEYPGERYLNLLPLLAWNHTDRFMPGLALSNTYWPPRQLQWGIAPMFSTETKTLTGAGEIQYTLNLQRSLWDIELGISGRSFHYAKDEHYGFFDRYQRGAARIKLIRHPAVSQVSHHLQYRYVGIRQQYGLGIDFENVIWEERSREYGVHELRYSRRQVHSLLSHTILGNIHAGRGFLRLTADLDARVAYPRRYKALYIHGFAGWLPVNDHPKANVLLHFNGIPSSGFFSRDYLYDEILPARNATSGINSQIVFMKDARLKTLYTGGISDQWMLATGLTTDIPLPIPVQLYVDVALYNDPFEDGTAFCYSSGLALVLEKDILAVYVPVFESKDIRNSLTYLTRDNIFKRISIALDLKALHPFKLTGY